MIESATLRQVLLAEDDTADTVAVPLSPIGKPKEIGALVAYLASPAAGFMTGATLDINGGQYLR